MMKRNEKIENGKITDVAGVLVGHATVKDAGICTGVTAVLPCAGNMFRSKLPAAAHVFNGFGKSTGLIQVQELGCIETPLLLTNTLSVGVAHTAMVRHMLGQDAEILSVNPVVLECNDGEINDIRALAVQENHAFAALQNASVSFEEGGVGAGAGMVCYSLKGGIGTAAQKVYAGEEVYTLGCLVLSNFGSLPDFAPYGRHIGPQLKQKLEQLLQKQVDNKPEKGSIIVVLATDAPLSSRQLNRIAKRAGVGIARTGAFIGHGSGEICLAFSTQNPIPHKAGPPQVVTLVHEEYMDSFFAATADAVEEAILRSMLKGRATATYKGGTVYAVKDVYPQFSLTK